MTAHREEWDVPRTEQELDDLFGAPDATPEKRSPLRLVGNDHGCDLPSAKELADEQYVASVYRVHEDTTRYPSLPWRSVAQLVGPMCPGNLVLVGARTGQGKSTFLLNAFDGLVESGQRGTYLALEQEPKIMRIQWACLRAGIAPKLVLAPTAEQRGTHEWQRAMDVVQDLLKQQVADPMRSRAFFPGERKIDRAKLRRWTAWAVGEGCTFVVVDHIDRIHHGEGVNPFHELSETVRLAKELAVEYGIVMLVASQVGRPHDALEQFMPPALHNLRGAGTKEEEADTVLGLYRPLRHDTTTEQLTEVRRGLLDVDQVREPNTMGVMLLKHRLDGPVTGKVARLLVQGGRILDPRHGERCATCRCSLAPADTHPTLCVACAREGVA